MTRWARRPQPFGRNAVRSDPAEERPPIGSLRSELAAVIDTDLLAAHPAPHRLIDLERAELNGDTGRRSRGGSRGPCRHSPSGPRASRPVCRTWPMICCADYRFVSIERFAWPTEPEPGAWTSLRRTDSVSLSRHGVYEKGPLAGDTRGIQFRDRYAEVALTEANEQLIGDRGSPSSRWAGPCPMDAGLFTCKRS